MPKPGTLAKATLTEMWPASDDKLKEQSHSGGAAKVVTVQFNPQTLKVSFSNTAAGGDQPKGSAVQFVEKGTTKLALELWFDVTLPLPPGAPDPGGDVRKLTQEVAFFMTPQKVTKKGQTGLLPPAVKFLWGSFLFKGTVDSMEETLEHFSEDGKPLRAGVTLSLSKQELAFEFAPGGGGGGGGGGTGPGGAGGPGGGAGTQPLQMAQAGDTIQAAAARAGAGDWKAVALANGIENPRLVAPGALLNVSGSASAAGAASLGLSGATAPGIGGGVSVSAQGSSSIRVAGSGSGSSGLTASASLRFTGPGGGSG